MSTSRKVAQIGSQLGPSRTNFGSHTLPIHTNHSKPLHLACRMPLSAHSRSPASSVSTADQPFTRARHSHSSSNDSAESLRHLELTDGPMKASIMSGHARARSFSFSGFDFQAGLLPLSETISEMDLSFKESPGAEKSIGLVHGTCFCPFPFRSCWTVVY